MTSVPDEARRHGLVKPLLYVSLAVNLFLFGLAIGWIAQPPMGGRSGGSPRTPGAFPGDQVGAVYRALEALPEPSQTRLRQQLESERSAAAPLRQSVNEQRQHLRALIEADHFDAEAAERAFAELRTLTNQIYTRQHAVLLDALRSLSAPERRVLLQKIIKDAPMHGRGGDGHRSESGASTNKH